MNDFIRESFKTFKNKFSYNDCHYIPQYKYVYETWDYNESKLLRSIPTIWIDINNNNNNNININKERILCKYILKQENLNNDFNKLMSMFNSMLYSLQMSDDLSNSNPIESQSSSITNLIKKCKQDQKTNKISLHNETLLMIQKMYKKDFEKFCYDINNLPQFFQIVD